MKIFEKIIFTDAFPNLEFDDFKAAASLLFSPHKWTNSKYLDKFKNKFSERVQNKNLLFFDSGRSALYFLLKNTEYEEKSQIIMPAFTCMVIVNSAFWANLDIVFVDINPSDYNSNMDEIIANINKKTKFIFIQHTFGKIINLDKLKNFLNEKNRQDILIIEDFAHTIPSDYSLTSDFGIYTFGIEKVFTSIKGGALLIKNKEKYNELASAYSSVRNISFIENLRYILNPIYWYIAIPLHRIRFHKVSLGALTRWLGRKIKILGIMIDKSGYSCQKPVNIPSKLSPSLAVFGYNQLNKLEKINKHRVNIAKIYFSHLQKYSDQENFDETRTYLRYPVLLQNEFEFRKVDTLLRSQNIVSGNWYKKAIYSKTNNDFVQKTLGYKKNLKYTESKVGKVINLPTSLNVSSNVALKIAILVKKALNEVI